MSGEKPPDYVVGPTSSPRRYEAHVVFHGSLEREVRLLAQRWPDGWRFSKLVGELGDDGEGPRCYLTQCGEDANDLWNSALEITMACGIQVLRIKLEEQLAELPRRRDE